MHLFFNIDMNLDMSLATDVSFHYFQQKFVQSQRKKEKAEIV